MAVGVVDGTQVRQAGLGRALGLGALGATVGGVGLGGVGAVAGFRLASKLVGPGSSSALGVLVLGATAGLVAGGTLGVVAGALGGALIGK